MILNVALRNICRRKFRTSITIIAILLATSLYSSIGSASTAVVISSIRAYTDYIGDFDILITGSGSNIYFNATNVTTLISNVSGVDVVSPRLVFGAYSLVKEDKIIRLIVVGINESWDKRIGSFELISGNLSLSVNMCLVLSDVARIGGIKVGDILTLYYRDRFFKIRSANISVAGIVKQYGKLPIDIKAAIFVSLETAQKLLNANGLANMVFVKLDSKIINPYDLDASIENMVSIGEEIQRRLGFSFTVTLIKAEVLRRVSEGISIQKAMLNTFASTALLMAIILIIFTITMNLHERIREIGVLRALGMGKRNIFLIFMSEAILLGILGSIPGSLLGIFVLQNLFLSTFRRWGASYVPSIVIDPYSILFSISLGILIALIGGIYPAFSASRIEPAEALSPAARRASHIEKLEKKIDPEKPITELIGLGVAMFLAFSMFTVVLPVLSFYGDIALLFMALFVSLMIMLTSLIIIFSGAFPSVVRGLRKAFDFLGKMEFSLANINLLRRRRRTLLAFFMISSAISALLLIGLMTSTQEESIIASIKINAGADVVIYAQEPIPVNYTANISRITGVASVCPVTQSIPVTAGDIVFWEKASVKLYGIDPIGYVTSSYIKEYVAAAKERLSGLNETRTVVISKGLADRLGLKINDELRLEIFKKTILLKIVGILPSAPGFSFTRFSSKASGTDILVSLDTYEDITGTTAYAYRFLIRVKVGFDPTVVAENITQIVGEDYNVQVIVIKDYIERASQSMEQLRTLLSTLLSFAVIIAVLGQMASIITTIREREWEIGVLRALGASRFQVSALFVVESLILAILGYISGFIGALVIATEINYSNNLISEISIPIKIPLDLSLHALALITVPTIILATIMAYINTRKSIYDTLRTAEIE